MPGLCRDCGKTLEEDAARCPACYSPRVIFHDELFTLSLAHLDCDAFFAAVEKRDRPELRNKPVLIGGQKRGVVATACYIARIYGVHSAMPMYRARTLCPDAVILPNDMKKYRAVSREIMAMLRDTTPLVEPLSLDEAFVDLTGTERLHGRAPAETLADLVRRIFDRTGITVSVGLSHNKFLAKLASDLDKPRGFAVIGRAEAPSFLAPMPVSKIWGVGRSLHGRLRRDGISTMGHLQGMDESVLIKRYGAIGRRLYHFARGEDERSVNPDSPRKGISSETTFAEDIVELDGLTPILWRQCEKVSRQLKARNIAARTVTLKLKTAGFRLLTRRRTLSSPTQLADGIYRAALPLLEKEAGRIPYRLLGVGASALVPAEEADAPTLLDPDISRRAGTERAIDSLREKFGEDAVIKGRGWRGKDES